MVRAISVGGVFGKYYCTGHSLKLCYRAGDDWGSFKFSCWWIFSVEILLSLSSRACGTAWQRVIPLHRTSIEGVILVIIFVYFFNYTFLRVFQLLNYFRLASLPLFNSRLWWWQWKTTIDTRCVRWWPGGYRGNHDDLLLIKGWKSARRRPGTAAAVETWWVRVQCTYEWSLKVLLSVPCLLPRRLPLLLQLGGLKMECILVV